MKPPPEHAEQYGFFNEILLYILIWPKNQRWTVSQFGTH